MNRSGARNPLAKNITSKSRDIAPIAPDIRFLIFKMVKIAKGTMKWVKRSIEILSLSSSTGENPSDFLKIMIIATYLF